MVHPFKYNFRDRDYHFVYDVESGSLHNIDKDTFLVAKSIYDSLNQEELTEFSKIEKKVFDEIVSELKELESDGCLNVSDNTRYPDKQTDTLKALCLHICHDCNLRCRYCFADEGAYHSEREYMSLEVGRSAIDMLLEKSGKRKNLEVDFFGGEPLMNLGVVKGIVEYARSKEKEYGKVFAFTMTTNCVLLNNETADWLNSEMSNVVLSIDGRQAVHNAVRKTLNGKDCYQLILDNALNFVKKRGDKSYYVRGTFTRENLDFSNDILALRDKGFKQISIEPVVLEENHILAIAEEDVLKINDEYERLSRIFIEDRLNEKKWFNFFHFMLDLDGGPCVHKRVTGCGCGCEYLAVTPNGELYPCHQFANNKNYFMGNVFDKNINKNIAKDFAKNVVTNKPDCEKCVAKYYCSGGCSANNLNFMGKLNVPYPQSCQMMRKRFELSLAISAIERSEF